MKRIVFISLLFIMITSCQDHEITGGPQTAYLHLQGGFNGDNVKIDIDGVEVYHNDSVVTNNLLGVADIDSTTQSYGNHEIKVKVNSNVMHIENFDLHQTLWLGISLHDTDSSIHILYFTEPFLYD